MHKMLFTPYFLLPILQQYFSLNNLLRSYNIRYQCLEGRLSELFSALAYCVPQCTQL